MEITAAVLKPFSGGQLTIDVNDAVKYCGEITTIQVSETLRVQFVWKASWDAATQRWRNVRTFLFHSVSLSLCGTPTEFEEDGSLIIPTGTSRLIFRKANDPKKLESANVEGL